MRKANVEKLETMAADFLQYRWMIHLTTKKLEETGEITRPENAQSPDFLYYNGACAMIQAFGGEWRRDYKGNQTPRELNDISKYSHTVWFPSDETCSRLNEDAWK